MTAPRTETEAPGRKGLFIVIESLDGVGKTTAAARLADRLDAQMVHTPVEPFQSIRYDLDDTASPQTRMLFFLAAVSHASQHIAGLLRKGDVVCDRYVYSTIAYQSAMDPACLKVIGSVTLLRPDIVFYLTAREEQRAARIANRHGKSRGYTDRLLEDSSFARQVDARYRTHTDLVCVDTSDLGPDAVVDRLADHVLAEGPSLLKDERGPEVWSSDTFRWEPIGRTGNGVCHG